MKLPNNFDPRGRSSMLGFLAYMLIGLILPSIILHPMKERKQQQKRRNDDNQKMKSIVQLQQELEDCAMKLEQEEESSTAGSITTTRQQMNIESTTTTTTTTTTIPSVKQNKSKHYDTAAICAIQKNGLYYIDEWVDYHLALGFTTIYIYDNSESNELRQWSETRNPNQIQVIHWPGSKQQKVAYKHCSTTQKQKPMTMGHHHKWLAMIDIDEFIVLDYNKYNSIIDLLDDYVPEDKAGLVLNRVNFYFSYDNHPNNNESTTNFDKSDDDYEQIIYRPVLQRFQRRVNWEDWYKTIAKTDWIILANVHGHSYSKKRYAVDINGNNVTQIPLSHPQGINDTPAIIYHYQTYSLKEFQSKCQRGDAAWGKHVVENSTSSNSNDNDYNEININNATMTMKSKQHHPNIIGNQESCLPSEEIQNRFFSRRKNIPGIFDDRPWKFLQQHVPKYRKYATTSSSRPKD